MPYITKTEQQRVDENPYYGRTTVETPGNPGVLNYRITNLLITWLGSNPRYRDFNAAIGALESAKLELYRRSIAAYEDQAIGRNGDVYPKHLAPNRMIGDDPRGEDPAPVESEIVDPPVAERRYI